MPVITRLGIENDLYAGRLGNKMFQAAACIGYAEKHGCEVIMPDWQLKNIFKNIKTDSGLNWGMFYELKEFDFSYYELPEIKENINLQGYFQSEKYFNNCSNSIRGYWFEPCDEVAEYADNIYNKLSNNGQLRLTVIQVRRDDYLLNPNYHIVQLIDYYKQAIEMLKDKTDLFVVFCDKSAEPWCIEEFMKLGISWILAPQDNYIGDIFVMSKCDNYIIANSSFGWWGAWMNPNQDKIQVIAPKNWFGVAANLNDKDLVPERWVRI